MGDEAAAAQETEFSELLGFLQDAKIEVRQFAAEGVLAQTDEQEFLDYCRRNPRKAAKGLLRLAEKAEADAATSSAAADVAAEGTHGPADMKVARMAATEAAQSSAAGSAALQALVNLSSIPTVRDELVEMNAPRRVMEAMRSGWLEGRSDLAHWYAMLLANVTTAKPGQEAVCADEGGLRFLVAAYIAKPRPPPRGGYEDPLVFLGKVLNNVCALEVGRRLLAQGEQGPATVALLGTELADRGRRADMVNALRNICLSNECHAAVVAADVLPGMAAFLYPWAKAAPAQRAELPEALGATLAAHGAALTGDAHTRYSAAICLVGLCQTTDGRGYLRAQGALELLRAWQAEESEEETRNAIDAILKVLKEPEIEELPAEVTATAVA